MQLRAGRFPPHALRSAASNAEKFGKFGEAIEMIGAFGLVCAGYRRVRWAAIASLIAALTGAGCATPVGDLGKDSPSAAKEAAVTERATARWQALIKKDYSAAYAFFSPSSRETTTLPKFQSRIEAIEYRAITIDKVECEAEVCAVKLTLTYDYPPARIKGVVTPLNESWIIDQGQAWFVFRG